MFQQWLVCGHGEYSELSNEPEFFECCKRSNRVVCHFYRDSTFRCNIVDKHLALLAPKHVETRFVKVNVEKVPFLVKRLNIRVLPTIALVKDAKTQEYIRGFDELGGKDEFPTEMLEWRLGKASVINYAGDLSKPPVMGGQEAKSIFGFQPKKKAVRGNAYDDDSSDTDDD